MKRTYLDANANYRAAKKGMRGMSIGPELDDVRATEKRIIANILNSPTAEAMYRRWALGHRDVHGFDHEPEGTFEDWAANSRAGENKLDKHFETPYMPFDEFHPEFEETWNDRTKKAPKAAGGGRKKLVLKKDKWKPTSLTENVKPPESKPNKAGAILIKHRKEDTNG